ncbi:MAG: Holliday junction resolvase RuvX [Acholeplasmatales bacterium]|jgi:putative Holliday junction resolvase|nr:Holliday junction resolvase RuvX [Acholeplasmatales bacterium]
MNDCYFGLDLGSVTCGIAISNSGVISSPYKTIRFKENDYNSLLKVLIEEINDNFVNIIVLGYPLNMNNTVGPRALICEDFKKKLEEKTKCRVYLQDERLSTVAAKNAFKMGSNYKKEKSKVDTMAAVVILQRYLDTIKRS